jgi:hypothetical protein
LATDWLSTRERKSASGVMPASGHPRLFPFALSPRLQGPATRMETTPFRETTPKTSAPGQSARATPIRASLKRVRTPRNLTFASLLHALRRSMYPHSLPEAATRWTSAMLQPAKNHPITRLPMCFGRLSDSSPIRRNYRVSRRTSSRRCRARRTLLQVSSGWLKTVRRRSCWVANDGEMR